MTVRRRWRLHRRLTSARKLRGRTTGGVGAFALLGIASAGYMAMRTLGIGTPGTLLAQGVIDEGAPVLLTDFQNSGDGELGGVVTKALRIDLLQSPTIRLYERADVTDALARMHGDDDAPITAAIGRQLAEREGFAAVISGDVATAGSGYVLTASILAGEGFRPMAAFRETARNDGELVDAIERLSRSIRDKIGESLRSVRRSPPLAQVTTTSLPALRAYTRGLELETRGDNGAALDEYERAVTLDSTFAMAYRKISGTLLNQSIRLADARRAARRAWELRDRLPPLERQLATGFFHWQVSGDIEAAMSAYEQALAIDSTDVPVRNNLGNLYRLQGRYAEAEPLFAFPLRKAPYAALWANLARTRFEMGDFTRAVATIDSAREALPGWAYGYLILARAAASAGDFAAADSLAKLAETAAQTPRDRALLREYRYVVALAHGRLSEAERIVAAPGAELFMADPLRSAGDRAMIFLHRGDTVRAVRIVQEALTRHRDADFVANVGRMLAILVAAGTAPPAAELLATWEKAVPTDELGVLGRVERELAAAQVERVYGDSDAALQRLESLRTRCPGCGAFISYEIGRTADDLGDADRAIAAYERSLEQPDANRLFDTFNFDLPRALRRLAELHDARGDGPKAAEYYARFLELWRDADPELQPQVRAARNRLEQLLGDRR